MQVMYTHLPNLKIIGKPTAGAFGSIASVTMPYSNYAASRQNSDFYRAEDTTFYLSHRNFPIDSFVWFDRASVCNGEDNILTTAIHWIKPSLAAVTDLSSISPTIKVYPNPSTGNFNIVLNTPVAGQMQFHLYNMIGMNVGSIAAEVIAGENKLKINLADRQLPVGTYLLKVNGKGIRTMVKKVVITN